MSDMHGVRDMTTVGRILEAEEWGTGGDVGCWGVQWMWANV